LVVLLSFSLYFVMPNTIGGLNVKTTEGYTTGRVILKTDQESWYDWIIQTLASLRIKSHKQKDNIKIPTTTKHQSSTDNLKSKDDTTNNNNDNNNKCKCNNYKEGGIQIEYSPKCCNKIPL